MQVSYVKYVKRQEGEVFLFYYEEGTIYCRVWKNEKWSSKTSVVVGALENFAVTQTEKELYLLYLTQEKNLVLAKTEDGENWKEKVLMQDGEAFLQTKFFMVAWKNSFYLIYHQPVENAMVHNLYCVGFENGKWGSLQLIDQCLPMQGNPYISLRIGDGHFMLYYRTQRNVICAREILLSPFTVGSVVPVIQTPNPCTELSLLQDSQKVHQLYIVKGLMRCQVVYQYKQAAAISTPRVIWQDGNCEKCIIYRTKGRLYLMWSANGYTYRCFSQDNGGHFYPVERMILPMPKGCIKGEFLLPLESDSFFATEAIADPKKGFEMYYFLQQFVKKQEKIVVMEKEKEKEVEKVLERDISSENELKNEIEEMRNILEERQEVLIQSNASWKKRVGEILKERNEFERKIYGLEETIEKIADERKQLENSLRIVEEERNRLEKTVEQLERKGKETEQEVRLEVAEKD